MKHLKRERMQKVQIDGNLHKNVRHIHMKIANSEYLWRARNMDGGRQLARLFASVDPIQFIEIIIINFKIIMNESLEF